MVWPLHERDGGAVVVYFDDIHRGGLHVDIGFGDSGGLLAGDGGGVCDGLLLRAIVRKIEDAGDGGRSWMTLDRGLDVGDVVVHAEMGVYLNRRGRRGCGRWWCGRDGGRARSLRWRPHLMCVSR